MEDRHYKIDFHYLFQYNGKTRETTCSQLLTAKEPREAIRAAGDYAVSLNDSNEKWGAGPVVCIKIYNSSPSVPYDFENSSFPWKNNDGIFEWKWDWGSTFHGHANAKWPATFSDELARCEHEDNPITTIRTWKGWEDGSKENETEEQKQIRKWLKNCPTSVIDHVMVDTVKLKHLASIANVAYGNEKPMVVVTLESLKQLIESKGK